MSRRYYSHRVLRSKGEFTVDLTTLTRLVCNVYGTMTRRGYFQKSFGFDCTDGFQAGDVGYDVDAYASLGLRTEGAFPPNPDRLYTEPQLFDLVEFLWDHVAKPLSGWEHDYMGCGYHYREFDFPQGREELRRQINEMLADYSGGWTLSAKGEVLSVGEPGLDAIFDASIPSVGDEVRVRARVVDAVAKFRRYPGLLSDRRDAVRTLVEVLEYLRPQLKKVLVGQDESDLFNLANRFGIRHNDPDQKVDYDQNIWLSWMFYYYLATVHASLRLIERQAAGG